MQNLKFRKAKKSFKDFTNKSNNSILSNIDLTRKVLHLIHQIDHRIPNHRISDRWHLVKEHWIPKQAINN